MEAQAGDMTKRAGHAFVAACADRAGGVLEVKTTDGKSRAVEYPATNAHEACVVGFSRILLEAGEPSASGVDGLRSIQLTDAMARSAWDGVHVRLAL